MLEKGERREHIFTVYMHESKKVIKSQASEVRMSGFWEVGVMYGRSEGWDGGSGGCC